MLKGIFALLLTVSLLFSFAACHSLPDTDEPNSIATEETLPEPTSETINDIPAESDKIIEYPEITLPQEVEALIPSIVKLYCYDYEMKEVTSHGTGFFIDDKGTFITNAHVVKGAYYVKARVSTGEVYNVDTIYSYSRSNSDHAVCAITGYPSSPVSFDATAELGEKVYALGYPGSTFKFYASEGEVVTVEQTVGNITYIENTAVIYDGNSGGILANADGEVLGITTGSLRGGDFVAVAYSEFASALSNRSDHWTILDRFHPKTEVMLTTQNAEDFFSISTVSESEAAPASVTLRLHDAHKKSIIEIGEESPSVTLALVDDSGMAVGDPFHLTFSSRDDLTNGVSFTLDSSAIPAGSFKIKIIYASGAFIIRD